MSHSEKIRNRHPAVLSVLLGVAILIVSAVVLVLAIGSRDSLPPADADLALERPAVNGAPLDPFDGKSFRYDPKRRVVYSVGKNLVDNGGSAMPLKGKPSDPELRRRHNAEDAVYPVEAVSGK